MPFKTAPDILTMLDCGMWPMMFYAWKRMIMFVCDMLHMDHPLLCHMYTLHDSQLSPHPIPTKVYIIT